MAGVDPFVIGKLVCLKVTLCVTGVSNDVSTRTYVVSSARVYSGTGVKGNPLLCEKRSHLWGVTIMSHAFGDLLRQYRARKAHLSQTRLAELAGYDQDILVRMAQGKKDLTG